MKKEVSQVEVTNVVKIFGSPSEVSRLRKMIDVNELGFDFDAVVRQPRTLKGMSIEDELTVKEEIHRLTTYGAKDILEWREVFWGTDWLSLEAEWITDNYLLILTMNSSPIPVIRKLTSLFEVKIEVATLDEYESAYYIIENGEATKEIAAADEFEVASCIIKDPSYDFKRWVSEHKEFGRSKRLEMEFLFNYGTPFLNKVKKVIKEDSSIAI